MKHPKTLKEIPIEGHIRKTPGGGVTTVDPHLAKREVNIEDTLKSFHNEAKNLREELLDEKGNLKIDIDEASDKLIQLYTKESNGVDPEDLYAGDGLKDVLSQTFSAYHEFIPAIIDNKYMKDMGVESFANMLTHPDFINEVHNRASKIKNTFNEMGVETGDQIDPFSFNVSKKVTIPANSSDIHDSLMDKNVYGDLIRIFSNNSSLGDYNLNMYEMTIDLAKMLNHGYNKHRKFSSTILPSLILSHSNSFNAMKNDPDNFMFVNDPQRKYTGASSALRNEFDVEMEKNFDIIIGDPNNLRTRAMEAVKKSDYPIDNKDKLLQFLKKVDDANLSPALTFITRKGFVPIQMGGAENKSIMKEFQKTSERIRGITEHASASEKDISLGVSKNPLAILTMSPGKHVQSCQSIVNEYMPEEINVSSHNANILSTLNSHKTNDFIIFKNNTEGEKAARASLNLYEDKFRYFEEKPIYGDGRQELTELEMFIQTSEDHISRNSEQPTVDYDTKELRDKLKTIDEHIESQPLGEKSKMVAELLSPEVRGLIDKKLYQIMSQEFDKGLKKAGETYLYGSSMIHSLSRAISATTMVKNIIGEIDRKNHMQKMAAGIKT